MANPGGRSPTRIVLGASVGWVGLSMVADGVPQLLLPYRLAGEASFGAGALGLATLVAIGLAALIQPLAGAWSDKVGRFPVVAAGVALCSLGLALLIVPGPAALPLVAIVIVLGGTSIAQAGQQALLPDAIDRARRGVGAGAKGLFDVGGAFLGFVLLAALLGAGDGPAAAGVLLVALAAGALASYILLRRDRTVARQARSRPPSLLDPRGSFAVDRREHGPLLRLIIARFLVLLGIYVVGRFLFLFVGARFGLDAQMSGQQAGGVLAALALVTVVASLPAGWLADRVGRRPVMVVGAVAAATGIASVGLATSVALLLVFGALMALGTAAFGAASWALLADMAAGADAGRLLGIANLGTAGAAAAAGGFGILIDAGENVAPLTGYGTAFGLAALFALAGALVAWRLAVAPGHIFERTSSQEAGT